MDEMSQFRYSRIDFRQKKNEKGCTNPFLEPNATSDSQISSDGARVHTWYRFCIRSVAKFEGKNALERIPRYPSRF